MPRDAGHRHVHPLAATPQPGPASIHLRKLEDASYLTSEKTGNGAASRTTLALTRQGRTALASYTAALRDLLAASKSPLEN